MKFILATTPIRQQNTSFPPVGATSLLDTLIRTGYSPRFYDINGLRPSFEEVTDFFRREKPDILGISAVVSTAYSYTKELSYVVKRVSPKTKIILGGCLAASAEILLRKCPIDVCVIGEGEKVLMNLVKHWERFGSFDLSRKELQEMKGIAFIDSKGDFRFTGYEKQLLPEELPQPNYDLLRKYSDITRYIINPFTIRTFASDSRSSQLHRRGQKCVFVMTGKGCVSRCTFCHRWIKGYRNYPTENIINTMKTLKEKYNVGFFQIGDESFGANPRILSEFIEGVRSLDILFRIGAMRIPTIYHKPEIIHKLKEVGCVEMICGMESGNDKILSIMEKRVTREQNLEVAKLLMKEGMNTVHQIVIGMPGENDKTIAETIECLKQATEDTSDYPSVSINYFQSLPGTPAYEFGRQRGLFGKTLDEEEAYLLGISNIDACSPEHYKNVTEEPISKVFLWPHKIWSAVGAHWYRKRGWKALDKKIDFFSHDDQNNSGSIFIRIWQWMNTKRFYFLMASSLRGPFWFIMLFLMRIRIYGFMKALFFTLSLRREEDRSAFKIKEPKSVRKMLTYPDPKEQSTSEVNMMPLRMGR